MTCKHAELALQYAQDWLQNERPWELWEVCFSGHWRKMSDHPVWAKHIDYRRKRQALCQVEGREVFEGDVLWHTIRQVSVTVVGKDDHALQCDAPGIHLYVEPENLTWTEPAKTKEVFLWAVIISQDWLPTPVYYATEEEVRKTYPRAKEVRRLDHTKIEVPV